MVKKNDGEIKRLQFAQDTVENLTLWVVMNVLNPVEPFNEETVSIYRSLNMPILKMWIHPDDKDYKGYMHIFGRVADKYGD